MRQRMLGPVTAVLALIVTGCFGAPSYPEFSLERGVASAGVELGVSTTRDVRRLLGRPQHDDLSAEGTVRAWTYGTRYRFFFTEDSVAVLAHVFEQIGRTELEAVLGAPVEEQRAPNHDLWTQYANNVAVLYDPLGERSKWIEYYQPADSSRALPE